MKVFNNIEEIEKYYNKETNTYVLNFDVKFNFDFNKKSNIHANNIVAMDINAMDINAKSINARNINACDINAWDINALDIDARHIDTMDIDAWNMDIMSIYARNIKAWNIKALEIYAGDISFFAFCIAYEKLRFNSIYGRRKNSKYLCLDSEPVIKGMGYA